MLIGGINRENVGAYMQMVKNMAPSKGKSTNPMDDCKWGDFGLRFTPCEVKFSQPNWNTIPTKREKPAMSEEEFEKAIIAEAQKNFSDGGRRDMSGYHTLSKQYLEVSSPDRRAVYNESMKKTGGKMNAAMSFFDNSGQMIMCFRPDLNKFMPVTTNAEWSRSYAFDSIYNGEMSRLVEKYGKSAMGKIDVTTIQKDYIGSKEPSSSAKQIDIKV